MASTERTLLRILVVEDNPDHRFLLVRALQRAAEDDLDIREAHDGAQALEHLHGRGDHAGTPSPDLMFLDLKMPRVSGFEVLESLRGDESLSQIPVIVLSSSDEQSDIDASYRLGANSYVTKSQPGPIHDLLPRLAEYWTGTSRLPSAPA